MAAALAMSVFGSLQIVVARLGADSLRDGVRRRLLPSAGSVSVRARASRFSPCVAQAAWTIVLVFSGSYDTLTDYAIFAVLIFVTLATASVFVFRRRDAGSRARLPHASATPSCRCSSCWWPRAIVINTLIATPGRALAGVALMLAGLPFYWYWSRPVIGRR